MPGEIIAVLRAHAAQRIAVKNPANQKIGRDGIAIRTAKTETMMAEAYKFSSRVARVLRPPSRRLFNVLAAEYAQFT